MRLVFCLEIFSYFTFFAYAFPFVLLSTLYFTLNRLSFCRALACPMYSKTATRDILRFHLPSSGHILVLVRSTLAAGNCIQMFYLYSFCKSPLFNQHIFSLWLCDSYCQISLNSYNSIPQGYAVLSIWCSSPLLFWYCLPVLCHQ